MSFFLTGNPPINSTGTPVTDASTSEILAELESSNFGSTRGGTYNVNLWVGCSTVGYFWWEQVSSTGIGSSAIVERTLLRVSANLTPQYVKKFKLGPNHRIRVRMETAISGGTIAEAKLQAEELD